MRVCSEVCRGLSRVWKPALPTCIAPLFEDWNESFSERGVEGGGEFERPDGFDEGGDGTGHDAVGMDAGKRLKEFRGEALGALGDGNAQVKIPKSGNSDGNRANWGGEFVQAGADAVVDAVWGAGIPGGAAEIYRFFVQEKLQEEAQTFEGDAWRQEIGV